MAKATGGDLMLKMLREFREMQEESKEQFARTEQALRALRMKCRVVFRRTQVFADQVRAFSREVDGFRDNMGEFATHVSALAKEVDSVKRTQTKMFGQTGRMLHQLAEAQASDRERIDALEEHVDGPGEG